MVARRTAPAKALLDATPNKQPEMPRVTPSYIEGRNGSNPRHTGTYAKLSLEADLSSASSIGMKFHAPSPRSPQLQVTSIFSGSKGHFVEGAPACP